MVYPRYLYVCVCVCVCEFNGLLLLLFIQVHGSSNGVSITPVFDGPDIPSIQMSLGRSVNRYKQ